MAVRMAYENFARDPLIREKVEDELLKTLYPIRDNRIRLEENWKRFYRIWNCELDVYSYAGRSKIFLAAARAAAETWVSAIARDFFPFDEWFRILAVEDVDDQVRAETLQALFLHFWAKQVHLKSEALPSIRQLVIYGTSPNKVIWKDIEQLVKAVVRKQDQGGDWKLVVEEQMAKMFYGPSMRVVDLFNFFVYPETVANVEDAEIVFEDMETTVDHIRSVSEQWMDPKNPDLGHVYEVPDEVFLEQQAFGSNRDLMAARRLRLQRMGLTNDPSDKWMNLSKNRRNIAEVYWNTDIIDGEKKQWLITLINDRYVVRLQENPFYRKTRPYLVPRLLRVVNEFYGRGVMETIDRVQYMFNDIVNQTLDGVQFEVNPITIIDPGKVSFTQSIKHAPGARWLMDPSGVEFTKPASVAQVGFQTLSILQGFIHDFSGANAALQGQPAVRGRGRAQNTASGSAQLLAQGSAPIQEVVEDLEHQFGEPLLERTYELAEQFMDRKIALRILGRRAGLWLQKNVDLIDVVGNYQFKWLGSTATRNRTVMGQQMINFANIARGFPPEVMQQLNWQWLAKKIWTEGMGQRDAEEMFNPAGFQYSIDPKTEFELVQENRPIKVSPTDDHMAHLKQHYMDLPLCKTQEEFNALQDHIAQTEQVIQQQIQQQQMQQMMMAQQAAMQQQGGKKPASGNGTRNGPAPPRPQNQPSGFGQDNLAALMQQLQGGGMQ